MRCQNCFEKEGKMLIAGESSSIFCESCVPEMNSFNIGVGLGKEISNNERKRIININKVCDNCKMEFHSESIDGLIEAWKKHVEYFHHVEKIE